MVLTRSQKKVSENRINSYISNIEKQFGTRQCTVRLERLTSQQIEKYIQNCDKKFPVAGALDQQNHKKTHIEMRTGNFEERSLLAERHYLVPSTVMEKCQKYELVGLHERIELRGNSYTRNQPDSEHVMLDCKSSELLLFEYLSLFLLLCIAGLIICLMSM